jgi:hypothetical protein
MSAHKDGMMLNDPSELGDATAPMGSEQWAKAVRYRIQSGLHDITFASNRLEGYIGSMQETGAFRLLHKPDGAQFLLWEDFCTTKQPHGLGYSLAHISGIIAERKTVEALAAKAEETPGNPVGTNQHTTGDDNVIPTKAQGNSATYLSRRIARDRPDILQRMKDGEFPSVRAAAIEAGIVKVPTALDLLKRAWAKATDQERAAFVTEVLAQQETGQP